MSGTAQSTQQETTPASVLDYCASALLAVLCLFVVPIHVISNNLSELQHIDLRFAFWGLLTLSAVVALACVLCFAVLARTPGAEIAKRVVNAALIFLCLTGLVLPLTTQTGQVETADIPLNWTSLIVAAAASSVMLLPLAPQMRQLVLLIAVFFIAMMGVSASLTVVPAHAKASDNKAFSILTTASSEKNIFVMSFDGLSRDIANDLATGGEPFRSLFRDFVFFENVVSTAPSTQTSLTSETVGGVDLKKEFDTEERMLAELDKGRSIISYLQRNGHEVALYGYYSFTFGDAERIVNPWTIVHPSLTERVSQVSGVFELAMARLFGPVLAFGLDADLFKWVGTASSDQKAEEALMTNVQHHQGAQWDIPNITGTRDYYAYVNELKVGTSAPVAHFMHFLHTHYPVDFDAECNYRSNDLEWFNAHQNVDGQKAETACALRQMARFLEKLRELGIYDNSLIILKSDHGAPYYYHDPRTMDSFHKYWGYARYTPVLAIKTPEKHQKAPIRDSRLIVLSDLALTICKFVAKPEGCEGFLGHDVLSDEKPDPASRYYVNVLKSADSTFKMDSHQSITLPRGVEFYRAFTDYLSSDHLAGTTACGVKTPTTTGVPFNNGLTDNATWMTWHHAERRFLRWAGSDCDATKAQIRIEVSSPAAGQITVFRDGLKVAEVKVPASAERSPLDIDVTLPQTRVPQTVEIVPNDSASVGGISAFTLF